MKTNPLTVMRRGSDVDNEWYTSHSFYYPTSLKGRWDTTDESSPRSHCRHGIRHSEVTKYALAMKMCLNNILPRFILKQITVLHVHILCSQCQTYVTKDIAYMNSIDIFIVMQKQ